MNETLQTIKNRYSCRSFTGEPLENEDMEAIALAAVQAPSAMNKQPWQIIVLKDKALIDKMDALVMEHLKSREDKIMYERMMGRGGKLFYNAPCIFYVVKKIGQKDLDCGIVAQNIALAATSLGLGNVICGMARMPLELEKDGEFSSVIIPEGYEFSTSVLVGKPTQATGTPHEPDLNKIKYIG